MRMRNIDERNHRLYPNYCNPFSQRWSQNQETTQRASNIAPMDWSLLA